MAVYQGARPGLPARIGLQPRTATTGQVVLPSDAEPATLRRRRVRSSTAVRAGRRSNRVGIILGGIVVAFLLAFFSLAQSMRMSATGYQIDRLLVEQDRLQAELLDLRSNIGRLGHEPAIRKQALDIGLGQLATPTILPAR